MRLFSFLFILLFLSSASATPLIEGGPNDYYDPTPRIQEVVHSVQHLHLSRAIAMIEAGKTDHYTWQELDFTLRWFPNHPLGLKTMSDFLLKYPSAAPPGKNADYYFDKAIEFRPDDSVVHTLYGIYLHKEKKYKQALKEYEIAEQLKPDSADLQYNMGLLYVKLKDYKNALKHAHEAYKLGHPLPGLRDELKKAGYWKTQNSSQQ